MAESSSASRSSASLSRLAASCFSLCSLTSRARLAIAILARSSFVRNLGWGESGEGDAGSSERPLQQPLFPRVVFEARFLWKSGGTWGEEGSDARAGGHITLF